jgi:hypothetical protein
MHVRVTVGEDVDGELTVGEPRALTAEETVTVGRTADMLLPPEPSDARVSRIAVRVGRTSDGWLVHSLNRNGVVAHPWALPAYRLQPVELLTVPRVALRVIGDRDRRHWVFLECAEEGTPKRAGTVATELGAPPRPLTAAQREVLVTLFADLLVWPPVHTAEPRQLKQVARQVSRSVSAVQVRLAEVRTKAEALGLGRKVALTDPEYLYVLVRAGYLAPDDAGLAS